MGLEAFEGYTILDGAGVAILPLAEMGLEVYMTRFPRKKLWVAILPLAEMGLEELTGHMSEVNHFVAILPLAEMGLEGGTVELCESLPSRNPSFSRDGFRSRQQ